MITEENLRKLYDETVQDHDITRKTMTEFGLNCVDVTNLVKEEVLERIERGHYKINTTGKYFAYLEKIKDKKSRKGTTKIAESPKTMEETLTLFLSSIQSQEYQKLFQYLEEFYSSDNPAYRQDGNFYLYLLSNITPIPGKYQEYLKSIRYENIQVNRRKKEQNTSLENKVRLSSFNKRFSLANKQMKELIDEKESPSVQDKIVESLLQGIMEVSAKRREELRVLIKEGRYDSVVQKLKDDEAQGGLNTVDSYILSLTKDLQKIIATEEVPKINIFETKNIFEAIDGKNYILALALSKENQIQQGMKESNHIHLLLEKIVEVIRQIKQKARKEEVDNLCIDTARFLIGLKQNDSLKNLKKYLAKYQMSEYEFVVVDLIKISLLEQDQDFTKPKEFLKSIKEETYYFNVTDYIQAFYEELSVNQFQKSRVYLDIIQKSGLLGQEFLLAGAMEEVLERTEQENQKIKIYQ